MLRKYCTEASQPARPGTSFLNEDALIINLSRCFFGHSFRFQPDKGNGKEVRYFLKKYIRVKDLSRTTSSKERMPVVM